IHVYGESFAQATAAGTVRGLFEMPPGTSRTIPIYIKAEKTGRFFVHFSGQYWPEGNKDAFQPISLTTPITVSAISPEPLSSVPTNSEQIIQANDSASIGGSSITEVVVGSDTPWYREPLFFVIVALTGAALIVFLGKTVITMTRD
ncbi:MAG: hypothetical protein IIA00_03635, partial [Proteobacteria bacterium]|nr:hypothetical protein [Pseudomonadota bacterium]